METAWHRGIICAPHPAVHSSNLVTFGMDFRAVFPPNQTQRDENVAKLSNAIVKASMSTVTR